MSLRCPQCVAPLDVVQRAGIEVDHCRRCGGVWLDRAELRKLVEREGALLDDDAYADDDPGRVRYHEPARPPPRRRGFFGRLFDFD